MKQYIQKYGILILFIFWFPIFIYGQGAGFVWMDGGNTVGSGLKIKTFPGSRTMASSWKDVDGNMWIFGGIGMDSSGNEGYLGDLWKHEIGSSTWIWVHGPSTIGEPGNYGVKGVPSTTNYPGARSNSVFWTDSKGKFWLFGGYGIDEIGNIGYLNDLWRFDSNSQEWTWISGEKLINISGVYGESGIPNSMNLPGSREGSNSWIDENDNLYIFGGKGIDNESNEGFLNDLWKYDAVGNHWTWLSGSTIINDPGFFGQKGVQATENLPQARDNSVSWKDSEGNLWLFGGKVKDNPLVERRNDVWKFDIQSRFWVWMSGTNTINDFGMVEMESEFSSLDIPSAREGSQFWIDSEGDIWLHGGLGLEEWRGEEETFLGDVWKFDLQLNMWSRIRYFEFESANYGPYNNQDQSWAPGGRAFASNFLDLDNNLVLIGGTGYTSEIQSGLYIEGSFNDVWKFYKNNSNWAWILGDQWESVVGHYGRKREGVPISLPGARTGFTIWKDNLGDYWLFGGEGIDEQGEFGLLSDLWKYDHNLRDWVLISSPGNHSAKGQFGPQYAPSTDYLPGARKNSVGWTENQMLYLFGGNGLDADSTLGLLNDVWQFNIYTKEWTWINGAVLSNQQGISDGLGLSSDLYAPGARENAVVWDDAQFAWVFGGNGYDLGSGNGQLNDLWRFDKYSLTWTWISGSDVNGACNVYGVKHEPSDFNTPGSREGAVGWFNSFDGNLILFGGYGCDSLSNTSYLNDVWKYDLNSQAWAWIGGLKSGNKKGYYGNLSQAGQNFIPGSRVNGITWIDNQYNLYLFGGNGHDINGNFGLLNDLWKYSILTEEWTWLGGESTSEISGSYGIQGQYNSSNRIGSRNMGRVLANQPDLLLFGGYGIDQTGNTGVLNDFWKIVLPPPNTQNVSFYNYETTIFLRIYPTNEDYFLIELSQDNFSTIEWSNSIEADYRFLNFEIPFENLELGTEYQFRIKGGNDVGESPEWFELTAYTAPNTPVLADVPIENISSNNVILVWDKVIGLVDSYELFVAFDDPMGENFAFSWNLNDTSFNVIESFGINLDPGTEYWIALKSVISGSRGYESRSALSNIISFVTKPLEPVANPVTNILTNGFRASWSAGTEIIDGYFLEVLQDGIVIHSVDSILTNSIDVKGLAQGKDYKYRVSAYNRGGRSLPSNEIPFTTTVADIPLNFELVNFDGNSNKLIEVLITGGTFPYTADILIDGIILEQPSSYEMSKNEITGNFEFLLEESLMDDIGLAFWINARDDAQVEKVNAVPYYFYKSFNVGNSPNLPNLGSGGGKGDWTMFSIPYRLDDSDIEDIFDEIQNREYRNDYRITRYENGAFKDYTEGLTKIELGKGYWFNSVKPSDIQIGAGQTNIVPFPMSLTTGWNQIGNPYNIPISWNAVLNANNNPAGVDPLQIFEGTSQKEGDVMPIFGAGYVYVDGSTPPLTIDPRVVRATGSRTESNYYIVEGSDINSTQWYIPLQISGETVGGFGMHEEATELKDRFDRMVMPRFYEFTELYTTRQEYQYPYFMRDVVPAQTEYSWSFTLESNQLGSLTTLTWDNDEFKNNKASLMLLDKSSGMLMDMKEKNSYSVNLTHGPAKFDIYYQSNGELLAPNDLILGRAYPNPTENKTTIPVIIPESLDGKRASLKIYDMHGRIVDVLVDATLYTGYHEFTWDTGRIPKQAAIGVYLYQLTFENGEIPPLQKRLIVK